MRLFENRSVLFPAVFNNIFTEGGTEMSNYENFSIPAVNIRENFANFVIELAVPGLKKQNFVIDVEKNILKISTNFTKDDEQTKHNAEPTNYSHLEFNYRSFKRQFILPSFVNSDLISATYEDGILLITIPMQEEQKRSKRMVEIS